MEGCVHRFWQSLILPVLDAVAPRTIVEVGAEKGDNTGRLVDWCLAHDALLHVIEPVPAYDVEALRARAGDHLVEHETLSLNALPAIERADLVLIDGDHNWYTVFNELRLLERSAHRTGHPFPLVLLHDVGWPYGRRDLYYDPETVPEAFRKPHRRWGMVPESPDLLETGGFNRSFENAIYENDLQNGVLSAVEDFAEASQLELDFVMLPAFHGLGVLALRELRKQNDVLDRLLIEFVRAEPVLEIMADVEQSRIQALIERDETRVALRAAEHRAEQAEGDLERAQAELLDRSEALATAQSQEQSAEVELQHLRARVEFHALELDSWRKRSERFAREVGSERAKHEESLLHGAELERKLDDARAEADAARAKVVSARAEVDTAQTELERARASTAELQRELERAAEDGAAQRAELERVRADSAELQRQLDRTGEDVAQLRSHFERQRADAAELSDELERTRSESAQARDELERSRTDVAHAREELEAGRAEFEQQRRDLDAAHSLVERLRSDLLEQGRQGAALRSELARSEAERARVERLGALHAELRERARETRELRAEASRSAQETRDLARWVEGLDRDVHWILGSRSFRVGDLLVNRIGKRLVRRSTRGPTWAQTEAAALSSAYRAWKQERGVWALGNVPEASVGDERPDSIDACETRLEELGRELRGFAADVERRAAENQRLAGWCEALYRCVDGLTKSRRFRLGNLLVRRLANALLLRSRRPWAPEEALRIVTAVRRWRSERPARPNASVVDEQSSPVRAPRTRRTAARDDLTVVVSPGSSPEDANRLLASMARHAGDVRVSVLVVDGDSAANETREEALDPIGSGLRVRRVEGDLAAELRAACGRYLLFVDARLELEPGGLESLLRLAEGSGAPLVAAGVVLEAAGAAPGGRSSLCDSAYAAAPAAEGLRLVPIRDPEPAGELDGDGLAAEIVAGPALLCDREVYLRAGRAAAPPWDDGGVALSLALRRRELATFRAQRVAAFRLRDAAQPQLPSDRSLERRDRGALERLAALGRLRGDPSAASQPITLAFAVIEAGPTARRGDGLTAYELGEAARRLFGWRVVYLAREAEGRDWYDLHEVDLLVVMVDEYELDRVHHAEPQLRTVAWIRNWVDRWLQCSSLLDYDLHLCASERAREQLAPHVPARVFPLATNAHRFAQAESDPSYETELAFTGHRWDTPRPIERVLDPASLGHSFAVYGSGWDERTPFADCSRGEVAYEELPRVYASTRLVIDDANESTLPWGSANSRIFDALAAGALVLTNNADASRELFGEALPVYRNRRELESLIREFLGDESGRRARSESLRNQVLEHHTYDARAASLRDLVCELRARPRRVALKLPSTEQEFAADETLRQAAQSWKRDLAARGFVLRVDTLEERQRTGADAVLVVGGTLEYEPADGELAIRWLRDPQDELVAARLDDFEHLWLARDLAAPDRETLRRHGVSGSQGPVDSSCVADELCELLDRLHARTALTDGVAPPLLAEACAPGAPMELASADERARLERALARRPEPLLVTVVMPTWNRAQILERAIASVEAQTYRHWELVVADDGSDDDTRERVERHAARDSRIRYERIEHRGVAAARNRGLEVARGEIIAYLDSDNLWDDSYLRFMVHALVDTGCDSGYAGLRIIDPERPDEQIDRARQFDRSELLRNNYIDINVFVHRRRVVEELGGFREELKRWVDWDLILRYTAERDPAAVPLLLADYDSSSTPGRITTDEADANKFKVLNEHVIDWGGLRAGLSDRVPGAATVVIPVYGRADLTEDCIRSLFEQGARLEFDVLVVDNASEDDTVERLRALCEEFPRLRTIRNYENYGFALGNNRGFAESTGEYVVFLNNDTLLHPDWLDALVEPLCDDDGIGLVGPKLLYPDGTLQCGGLVFGAQSKIPYHIYQGLPGDHPAVNKRRSFNALTGACLAVRAADFCELRGFDPLYWNGGEDIDLCMRMAREQDRRALYEPRSVVTHLEGKTEGRRRSIMPNRELFVSRFRGWIEQDDVDYFEADGFRLEGYVKTGAEPDGETALYAPELREVEAGSSSSPERVLVVKPSGIGNMIMGTPALRALREYMPDAHITLACYEAEAPIARPLVDDVMVLKRRKSALGDLDRSEFEETVGPGDFDLAVYLPFTNLGRPTAHLERCIERHVWHPEVSWDQRHEVLHNLDVVAQLGWEGPIPLLETPVDESAALGLPEGAIGIHMGASGTVHMQKKKWPAKHWARLLDRLPDSVPVVLCGGPGEEADADELLGLLEERTPSSILSRVGKLSLAETAGVISACRLFLSNDSGLMHMASAVGTPAIGIFGPTLPSKNRPWGDPRFNRVVRRQIECSPCYPDNDVLMACPAQRCLEEVSPEQVWGEIQAVLRELGEPAFERRSREAGPRCSICGSTSFAEGPGGRTSSTGILPHCCGCQSLERHRVQRAVLDCLPGDFFASAHALQISPDPGVPAPRFASLEVSVYGGENSLDLEAIERDDASYDYLVCNHVLEHVANDRLAFSELLRVLRPDGILQLSVPNPIMREKTTEWGFADDERHGHYREYGRDLLDRFRDASPGTGVIAVEAHDAVTRTPDLVYFWSRDAGRLAELRRHVERRLGRSAVVA
jgi:glycosyltransferase involved in cell wall biosynthesis/ADP-heptose:LPS heptosyltransferase